MSAPIGTWNINANGVTGILTLSGPVNITGTQAYTLTGTVFGDPLTGVWDDDSQVLSFSRATHNGPDFQFEVYSGTLLPSYSTPNELVPGTGQVPRMITGNFGTARASASFGPFDRYGWFAA
jgi:hypothetical protein